MAFRNFLNNKSKNNLDLSNNNGSKINLTNIGNPSGPINNINNQGIANPSNINLNNQTQSLDHVNTVEAETDNELNHLSNLLNITNQKKYL